MASAARNRSPAYPASDLKRCVAAVQALYAEEHFRYVGADRAIELFGYSPTSSTGHRLLAALLQFGLLEEKGTGSRRQVRVSRLGVRIALADQPETGDDYHEALQEAALHPEVYRDLWERWDGEMPSRGKIAHYLVVRLEFNPKAVESVIDDFESTLRYAGLLEALPEETPAPAEAVAGAAGEAPAAQPFDLSIPLTNGQQARLTLPMPLSETDFDLLLKLLSTNLDVLRESLLRDRPPSAPRKLRAIPGKAGG